MTRFSVDWPTDQHQSIQAARPIISRVGRSKRVGAPESMKHICGENWLEPTVAVAVSVAQAQRPSAFQSLPAIIRFMSSSKSGTVNAVSP